MNLKHLRYFYWVSKLGSYSRAADQLDVTQPCIYRAVRDLERSCGLSLLRKQGGRLTPTRDGRTLYDYAERIQALEHEAEESVADMASSREDVLVLGVTPPFAYATAEHLTRWKSEQRDLRLDVMVGLRNDLFVRVLDRELEVAIAPLGDLPVGLRSDGHVIYDELVFVVKQGHPLSKRRAVTLADVLNEEFVTTFPAAVGYRLLREMGANSGSTLKASIRVDNSAIAAQLVASGAGIGLVSKFIVAEVASHHKLARIEVPGSPYRIPYGFVFRSDSPPSSHGASLVAYLSQVLA